MKKFGNAFHPHYTSGVDQSSLSLVRTSKSFAKRLKIHFGPENHCFINSSFFLGFPSTRGIIVLPECNQCLNYRLIFASNCSHSQVAWWPVDESPAEVMHAAALEVLQRTLLVPVTCLFNNVSIVPSVIKTWMLKLSTRCVFWTAIIYSFNILSLKPFLLRFCKASSLRQQLIPLNKAFWPSWPAWTSSKTFTFSEVWLEVRYSIRVFTFQYETRGRVFVQLPSGNMVCGPQK